MIYHPVLLLPGVHMSHTTAVTTDFKNKSALTTACERVGAKIDTAVKSVRLYQGTTQCDTRIDLKDWQYPLAVNTETGKVQFDNYNGMWGKIEEFDKLRQEYSVACVEQEGGEDGLEPPVHAEEQGLDYCGVQLRVYWYTG